ncbi:C-type lectin-like [Branchiostoma floridae]|uniref:C-type lectin-like n=1 Tax=Branchiostoma floridae TaxID=7739 RepID=A0A9J7MGA7_BRAFL|nr:C-type lectin-like [Branchiostoma floridae]
MPDKLKWTDAKSRCEQHGAHLTSVKDATENKLISQLISSALKQEKDDLVWIGLTNGKKVISILQLWGSDLKWTDGSPVSYTNWAKGQPTVAGPFIFIGKAGGNCAGMYSKKPGWLMMGRGEIGQWKTGRCDSQHPFICKKPK